MNDLLLGFKEDRSQFVQEGKVVSEGRSFQLSIKQNGANVRNHTYIQTQCAAKGRLCLADAMTWSQGAGMDNQGDEGGKPDVMLDVATLTGACVVALGEHAAGE